MLNDKTVPENEVKEAINNENAIPSKIEETNLFSKITKLNVTDQSTLRQTVPEITSYSK